MLRVLSAPDGIEAPLLAAAVELPPLLEDVPLPEELPLPAVLPLPEVLPLPALLPLPEVLPLPVVLPLPEELPLPAELLLPEELPFPAELPFVGGALPDPLSVPPAATVLAESGASAPPHPARIEMAAKFRRTKTKTFFLIVFTCFFPILAAFNQRGLAFALRNGQALVRTIVAICLIRRAHEERHDKRRETRGRAGLEYPALSSPAAKQFMGDTRIRVQICLGKAKASQRKHRVMQCSYC